MADAKEFTHRGYRIFTTDDGYSWQVFDPDGHPWGVGHWFVSATEACRLLDADPTTQQHRES